MRIEERKFRERMAKIVLAGRVLGARLAILVQKMETEEHFAIRPDDEDWSIVEATVEIVSTSKHFTEKHGDEIEAYRLFHAAAKAEFFGVFDKTANARAVVNAEDSYMNAHWFDKLDELEAGERMQARA